LFQIGDRVFYPMHGAGIVKNIEDREVLGERKTYYILQFPINNMTVMLPTDNVERVGLREIVDKESLLEVESLLRKQEEASSDNWNQRFRQNANMLKSGDIFAAAQVFKSLILRNRQKALSTGEKKMLDDAKQYLISEIALVHNVKQEQATRILEEAVE
jgi:CarD family transcriptional regulator